MLGSCSARPVLLGSLGASLLLAVGCGSDQVLDDLELLREGLAPVEGYVQGQYEARIATMLDGTSRLSHHVKVGEQVYDLDIDDLPFEQPEYDTFVRVPGDVGVDGRWHADDFIVLSPPPQPLIDPEFRAPRRIGTVLVFWEGEQGLPNSAAESRMYSDNESTNVYYGEISYGIETIAGKVFGPYEIEDPGGCSTTLITSRAEAAMIDRGHDPTQFRQMMFYFPGGNGCGFAGLASVGTPENPARNSWYHGSFGCNTRNQEIGHNYGMGHSHAYMCPPVPDNMDHNLYEDCEHVEYGHPYDPMGDGCGHMNVVQKTYMGWLEGCNVVTATSSGTFNLLPTELPCDGTQALRFPSYYVTAGGVPYDYYIEYRNGVGDFAIGSGVLINIAPSTGTFGPPNYVLDEQGELENGYLHEGDSFTDPGSGTTFTILEEYESHVVIDVTIEGGGDGQPPTCLGEEGAPPIEPVMEAGAIGSLSCAAEPYPADDTPPEVTITFPADDQVFEPGSDFTITADATDDRQIIEVALYSAETASELGGAPVQILTEPPWEWDAVGIPAGNYVFAAVARDARHLAQSQIISIEVAQEPSEDESGESGEQPAPGGTGGETDNDDETGDGGLTGANDGCQCHAGDRRPGGAGFAVLLLGLGWLRRRRSAA